MTWRRQATSRYLRQCWSRSVLPYGGLTRPQWINSLWIYGVMTHFRTQAIVNVTVNKIAIELVRYNHSRVHISIAKPHNLCQLKNVNRTSETLIVYWSETQTFSVSCNQVSCVAQDICQKRILNPNLVKFCVPKTHNISFTQSFRFFRRPQQYHHHALCRISNDWTNYSGIVDEQKFARFEFNISFWVISYIAQTSGTWKAVVNSPCDNAHYCDVIMEANASQITSLTIVYSAVYLGADHRKHQSSASLAFVRGIHRRPVNSPHKWPVTRKMFPFDDVIMQPTFLFQTAIL